MIRGLDARSLTTEEATRLIAVEETNFLDLKAKALTPAKLSIAASSFANTAGGEIYLGIQEKPSRKWDGFASQEDVNAHIQALHDCFTGSDAVSAEFLSADRCQGYVLHLTIQKTGEVISASDGKIYVRVGAQKLPIPLKSHEEIERLKLDKGLISYEDTPVAGPDLRTVTHSLVTTEFMLSAVPVSDPEVWLPSQRLVLEGRPTVACLLLFCDEPQVWLPKRSGIKILRYKTAEGVGTRDTLASAPLSVEGSLTRQIETAVEKVISLISAERVQTSEGLQEIVYPHETIHEIVTNAVLHRDYSVATDVQIQIYDNRIVIESPGRLPGHITPANILDEQFARNGKLVRLINKFPDPPNKDVGEGLNTAFLRMRQLGLKAPVITETPTSVLVEIRHERLASQEEQVLTYLENHPGISNSIARKLTGEGSENKMKRVFERMMAAGQIYRDPSLKGRATTYRLGRGPVVPAIVAETESSEPRTDEPD